MLLADGRKTRAHCTFLVACENVTSMWTKGRNHQRLQLPSIVLILSKLFQAQQAGPCLQQHPKWQRSGFDALLTLASFDTSSPSAKWSKVGEMLCVLWQRHLTHGTARATNYTRTARAGASKGRSNTPHGKQLKNRYEYICNGTRMTTILGTSVRHAMLK